MNSQRETGTQPVMSYVIWFALVHLGLLVLLAILASVFQFQLNAGASMGALIGAASLAGQRFVAGHGRPPVGREVTNLTWLSVAASWLISLIMLAPMVMFADANFKSELQTMWTTLGNDGVALITVAATLVYALVLWISYGPLTRFIARSQAKSK